MRDPRSTDTNIVFRACMNRLRVPDPVPKHREGLRQAIAALVETAAEPLPPYEPTPLIQALTTSLTPAQREKDRLLCEAWDALASDQRAALRIAETLSCQRMNGPRRRTLGYLVVVVGFPVAIVVLLPRTGAFWSLAFFGLCFGGLWWIDLHFGDVVRRLGERVEDADVQVALAMDHPGRYLEALEKLEAAELAGWEALRGEARMERPFSRRRKRLCARLGFTRSAGSGLPPAHRNSLRGSLQDQVRPGTPPATEEDIDRAIDEAMREEWGARVR